MTVARGETDKVKPRLCRFPEADYREEVSFQDRFTSCKTSFNISSERCRNVRNHLEVEPEV